MIYQVWLKVEFRGRLISEDPIHVFDSLEEAVQWCHGKDYFFIRVYSDDGFDYQNYTELDCFGDLA